MKSGKLLAMASKSAPVLEAQNYSKALDSPQGQYAAQTLAKAGSGRSLSAFYS